MTRDPSHPATPRSLPSLEETVFTRGSGADLWDAQGRRYTDFVCGYGPVVLGHGHPAVVEEVHRQLQAGTLYPSAGRPLRDFLDVLSGLFPEQPGALLFKTGSEAVGAAMRLARHRTGRDMVLRLGFHGWHDQVISPHVNWHRFDHAERRSVQPLAVPGIYGAAVRVWHGDEVEDLLETVRSTRDLAAVVVDPVELPLPLADSAKRVLEAAHEAGALLVLDETKTCLRLGPGGAQERLGVTADVLVLGKAIANGLPLAVVLTDPALTAQSRRLRIRGTFSNELASVAAASATLRVLREEKVHERLERTGTALIDAVNAALRSEGLCGRICAVPYHWPCMPYLRFRDIAETERMDFYARLVRRGVLLLPNHMNFVSAAHTDAHVEHAVRAIRATVQDMLGDGLLESRGGTRNE
ncbi:aminotransferase class III-fold pyridoxal phosphate-dependent enzyme [Streptomyces sp. Go-475]|uniref:aminotransferase class III-fold pyridoxal phosphate-dependent enzyme n=1 Tax=Streptomyces sp. Go-475 TaxID=2072505 RepID=UPI000DF0C944|nr:aminotransferase class III-fold pyridoxal phosphate-dependent enzyme [Streptomyces sp. Go-475]AXE89516.1 3-aminobutyryl-CoA aminotransferase [Streptomyces sp. Go-475]